MSTVLQRQLCARCSLLQHMTHPTAKLKVHHTYHNVISLQHGAHAKALSKRCIRKWFIADYIFTHFPPYVLIGCLKFADLVVLELQDQSN